MVSAAKLRRAQEAITHQRPYAKKVRELIQLASELNEDASKSPLILGHELPEGSKKKLLLLVVTSDRGLCGGFNSNAIKTAQRWMLSNGKSYQEVRMAFLGKRGYDFFKTKKVNLGPYFVDLGGKVTFAKAKRLSENLVKAFNDDDCDEIKVIYNEFKNAASQQTQVEDFLPIGKPRVTEAVQPTTNKDVKVLPNYIVKPSKSVLLAQLIEKNFTTQAFRIMLESQAGEHGARMSAMENATKNAGEMIRKLTLQYNKQRQAGITKELLEIISGSESQKGT